MSEENFQHGLQPFGTGATGNDPDADVSVNLPPTPPVPSVSIWDDPDENTPDDARDDAPQTSDADRAEAEGITIELYREMKSKGWR